ncbi:hypothetical protein [Microbacterium sp. SLBN-146]|uniref:hypothetical protein n=1 Tax=Microbacterium sp. SLBN-146 TaxID=2768457 RepID=UPI00114D708C|nr:hypothetical protein [Microbacterium sp. SLBN-146]
MVAVAGERGRMSDAGESLDAGASAHDPGTSRISRRRVLTGAALAVPAIVLTTALPARASSSDGMVPIVKLRVDPDFAAENAAQYDPVTNTNRGPIAVYVRVRYDQGVVWWPEPDPSPAIVPWTVSVTGPLGSTTLSGSVSIALGGYAQHLEWYPSATGFPVPPGLYQFTLTIFGTGGSASSTTTLTIA